jgi:hypothetical protein
MRNSGNKSMSPTDEELMDYLSIRCGAKMHYFLKTHDNPKEHPRRLSEGLPSKKDSSLVLLLLNLDLLKKDELYSPRDLLDIATRSLTKESETEKFVNDSTWSKALSVLSRNKIMVNVRDKSGFKDYRRDKLITFDAEGRYSRYYTSLTTEKIKYAMSNPIITDSIHDRLKKSGFLDGFLTYYFELILHMIINYGNSETSVRTLRDFFRSIDDSSRLENSEWESFRNTLSIANDDIIKKIACKFVIEKRVLETHQIQKPLYSILFLLALLED